MSMEIILNTHTHIYNTYTSLKINKQKTLRETKQNFHYNKIQNGFRDLCDKEYL